ncbi:MAG: hypothetical protein Q4B42_06815 [Oscillospiraceae bacterium]|nr:hypothetical protein [Oscillospiraceae bacterium]
MAARLTPEEKLAKLESEIARYEDKVKALKEKKKDLTAPRANYRVLVSSLKAAGISAEDVIKKFGIDLATS